MDDKELLLQDFDLDKITTGDTIAPQSPGVTNLIDFDQLTPITRILQARKKDDVYTNESPGFSPNISPAVNLRVQHKVRELELKVVSLRKDNEILQNEVQNKETLEHSQELAEQANKQLEQKLAKLRKDLNEQRIINDEMMV
uniref:Uncharacterized protein n=1 Tax=Ciona savignyi TaxID=51511 RepID=H2Z7R6_CIOSA